MATGGDGEGEELVQLSCISEDRQDSKVLLGSLSSLPTVRGVCVKEGKTVGERGDDWKEPGVAVSHLCRASHRLGNTLPLFLLMVLFPILSVPPGADLSPF